MRWNHNPKFLRPTFYLNVVLNKWVHTNKVCSTIFESVPVWFWSTLKMASGKITDRTSEWFNTFGPDCTLSSMTYDFLCIHAALPTQTTTVPPLSYYQGVGRMDWKIGKLPSRQLDFSMLGYSCAIENKQTNTVDGKIKPTNCHPVNHFDYPVNSNCPMPKTTYLIISNPQKNVMHLCRWRQFWHFYSMYLQFLRFLISNLPTEFLIS